MLGSIHIMRLQSFWPPPRQQKHYIQQLQSSKSSYTPTPETGAKRADAVPGYMRLSSPPTYERLPHGIETLKSVAFAYKRTTDRPTRMVFVTGIHKTHTGAKKEKKNIYIYKYKPHIVRLCSRDTTVPKRSPRRKFDESCYYKYNRIVLYTPEP